MLTWFGKRREIRSVSWMQDHLALTTRAVEELGNALQQKIAGQEEKALESINKVYRMEEQADHLRGNIAEELTKGEIPPQERDDLLHLSRDIDWIADWSKEAGRILRYCPISKLPKELSDQGVRMIEKVKETAFQVRICVERLTEDPQEALQSASKVENLEEETDALYSKVRSLYPTIDFSIINPGEMVLVGQLFDAIENITDWCENTVDEVRVLAIRML